MEAINFVYWLQGFLELENPQTIDAEKVETIKQHIALVLNKVTYPVGQPFWQVFPQWTKTDTTGNNPIQEVRYTSVASC